MNIKKLHIRNFGPYSEYTLEPSRTGLQLIYGPNESGKTTLLEAIRLNLFGGKSKRYDAYDGYIEAERKGISYHIGRKGRKLEFYPEGGARIAAEPSALWWHGLDRKTYERIFAITIEDMQGTDILKETDIRTRFFGAEGGASVGSAVKKTEAAATELLVASVNGKRKINVLMEALKRIEARIAELGRNEDEYARLAEQRNGLSVTERELQTRLNEWEDYIGSVQPVLAAWDTYRRGEEAKVRMRELEGFAELERERFEEIDGELDRCREHMKIWQGKEDGLRPEDFDPESPLGLYAQDIEQLYQQISGWEQLKKEVNEGRLYLEGLAERMKLARRMYTAWRPEIEMPREVDWAEGERRAADLRAAREAYEAWKGAEPEKPADMPNLREADEAAERVAEKERALDALRDELERRDGAIARAGRIESAARRSGRVTKIGLVLFTVGLCAVAIGLSLDVQALGVAGVLSGLAGAGALYLGRRDASENGSGLRAARDEAASAERAIDELAGRVGFGNIRTKADWERARDECRALRIRIDGTDRERAALYAYETMHEKWTAEGRRIAETGDAALVAWQRWLPEGAIATMSDGGFFGMKQEYDAYAAQEAEYARYERKQSEVGERLADIVSEAESLRDRLELAETPDTPDVKRLYQRMKIHKQHMIRWEQKESQRKSFREEYDRWSRKEKDLLLQQEELLQKSGIKTAGEYRRNLLKKEQYAQWETIYRHSRVQLELLAPRKESYDLMRRRLQEGNKAKWEGEYERGRREKESLERKLADLYEQRGELNETMRRMGDDMELDEQLRLREETETQLADALEAWAVQVFVGDCMEKAQQTYERERQPQLLTHASRYIEHMTGGKYRLDIAAVKEGVYLVDEAGIRHESKLWSSGLADQVYLAIRLALAKTFGERVEPMPIILDDCLIRFDEERQLAALKLLAELAETEQIVVLTCQQSVLEAGRAYADVHLL